jgi:hypothetical protein
MPNDTRELPATNSAARLKFLHCERQILPRNFKWISGTAAGYLPVPKIFSKFVKGGC